MAATNSGRGYWILEANGVVNAFGDAKNYGHALGARPLMLAAVPN
jgi:hypothetical protein